MMTMRALACGLFVLMASTAAHADPKAEFIRETSERHGVDPAVVEATLAQARYQQSIINAISRPAEARPWKDYRPIFLTDARTRDGRRFMAEHIDALRRIEADTGVPPEMIVSILGVETSYGGNTGSFRVLDALYTLGFHYPPRQDFFRSELGHLFALVQEQGLDINEIRGSYAGAMGWGQFIPSSYRHYARDGDGSGRIDLFNSLPDVFASVANYFAEHGWKAGDPIAVRAIEGEGSDAFTPDGYPPTYTVGELAGHGIVPTVAMDDERKASIVRLEGANGPETWMVFENFYVITRYNRSPLYAMAVMQLAEEIAAGAP